MNLTKTWISCSSGYLETWWEGTAYPGTLEDLGTQKLREALDRIPWDILTSGHLLFEKTERPEDHSEIRAWRRGDFWVPLPWTPEDLGTWKLKEKPEYPQTKKRKDKKILSTGENSIIWDVSGKPQDIWKYPVYKKKMKIHYRPTVRSCTPGDLTNFRLTHQGQKT